MKKKIYLTLSIIFLIILGSVLYAVTLRGVPGPIETIMIKGNLDQATKPLELSPERGRFLLTKSLVEDNSFALSPALGEAALPDVGVYKDKFYILFAPGISILAVPFYMLGENLGIPQVTAFAAIAFFATLNLILLFLIAKNVLKLPYWTSLLIPILFGFVSTSWSYAITLYQHHVTTFFILSSFYAAWKFKNSTSKLAWIYPFYIGIAYGGSIWLDYPNAILLLPSMVYFLITAFDVKKLKNTLTVSFRSISLTILISFVALMGLHGYYNHIHFGGWNRVSGGISSYKKIVEAKAKAAATNTVAPEVATDTQRNVVNFFKEEKVPKGFAILTASPDRGIFFYSPIFLLGLIGIFFQLGKLTLERGIILSVLIVNVLLYSSWGDPWGGWAFGPRYLIPSMSMLSLFTGMFLCQFKKLITNLILRIVALLLVIYSAAVSLLGAVTTNAVPPKIEADFLKMGYNYYHNLEYFLDNRSSSYAFNEFFSSFLNLTQFYFLLLSTIVAIVAILLFVPFILKHESRSQH